MTENKTFIEDLYRIIAQLDGEKDVKLLFDDLLTKGEVAAFATRLEAAKLLIEGLTYEEVIKETDISSATLSRVSKCVKRGGGYIKFLKREK